MSDEPLEPAPEELWEPKGLAEAARAAHADAEAETETTQSTPEGEATAAPAPVPWDGLVGMVVDLVFGRLAERDEVWTLASAEREALVRAWADALATIAMAPGPWSSAALATAAVVVPKAYAARANARGRTVDVEADVTSAGQ